MPTWLSRLERVLGKDEVTGSIPVVGLKQWREYYVQAKVRKEETSRKRGNDRPRGPR